MAEKTKKKIEENELTEEEKLREQERKEKVSTIVEDIKEIDLSQIESPYELIILLIEKANSLKEEKIGILDFPLADITSDYIKLMQNINQVNMEVAAEFISIASTLIKIKSEMLLPHPDEEELAEAEDLQTKLQIATYEYELFTKAAQKLTTIEDYNKKYRDPAPYADNYRIVLKQMSVDSLVRAFTRLMERVAFIENQPEQTIEKDRWTVEDKIFEIQTLLFGKERINFFSLIDEDYTRGEVINLFLALLELVKTEKISVQQDDSYGDIMIYEIKHDNEELEIDYTYEDEEYV